MFLWDKSYNLKGFWYYILGSFILILFSTIGQIPLLFFVDYDSVSVDTTSVDLLNTIPSNLRLFLLMISFWTILIFITQSLFNFVYCLLACFCFICTFFFVRSLVTRRIWKVRTVVTWAVATTPITVWKNKLSPLMLYTLQMKKLSKIAMLAIFLMKLFSMTLR